MTVVVEGGNVVHHVKSNKGLSGWEKYPAKYVLWEYIQGKCPDPVSEHCLQNQRHRRYDAIHCAAVWPLEAL